MKLYCCGCEEKIPARLTDGTEIYPHRPDLADLPFWKCDACGNFVGCHYKTADRTKPLGCIPTPEIKVERKKIHALLDPVWKSGQVKRATLYGRISRRLGWNYHTASIQSLEEAQFVYRIAQEVIRDLNSR